MELTKICEGCGSPFTVKKDRHGHLNRKKRFCDRQCWLKKWNREDQEHTLKGVRASNTSNIAKYRGTGSRTYVKENGRHQHRVIAEKILGRLLTESEVVHHEDRNKKNNDPENLIVFATQADHAWHHVHCADSCTCTCIRFEGGDAR
jgi:hypothetical protein